MTIGTIEKSRYNLGDSSDPLSQEALIDWEMDIGYALEGGEEKAKILTNSLMTCDEARYFITHTLKILLNDESKPFFEKSWDMSVARSDNTPN